MQTGLMKVRVGGYEIAYRRCGTGVPVLLVHGVASHSFLWVDIMQRLAGHYDLIATDLLGCGESEKPKDKDYSIDVQSDLLIELIENLGLNKVHLVGHDVGGGVVQLMAVKRPDLLIDLTMINPVGYDYWPVQPITTMRLPMIRTLTSSIMNRSMLKMVVRRAVFRKDLLTESVMDKFWHPLETREGKEGFVQLIRCINNRLLTSITDKLRKIEVPTLILRGEADAYLSRKITDDLAADIPRSKLKKFSKAGHFMQLDIPQEISAELSDFFSENVA